MVICYKLYRSLILHYSVHDYTYVQMESELCRDRCYPTQHITDLPRRCPLDDDGRRWLDVDYSRVDELDECRRMVNDAASRGDNVGVDQFKDEDDFAALLNYAEVFVAKDGKTGTAMAFIVIHPCWMAR